MFKTIIAGLLVLFFYVSLVHFSYGAPVPEKQEPMPQKFVPLPKIITGETCWGRLTFTSEVEFTLRGNGTGLAMAALTCTARERCISNG